MRDPTRLVQLTDGVFAIIMTLLVLEIKVPGLSSTTQTLREQLNECAYELFLYAISFLLAGVYWMSHRMLFSMVKKINTLLAWMNILFLMLCSLIPFAAAMLGKFSKDTMALEVYGVFLALLAGWRLLMYLYITSHHELIYAPVPFSQKKAVLRVMYFAPVMFIISAGITPYFPTAALFIDAFTPPMFVSAITYVNHKNYN